MADAASRTERATPRRRRQARRQGLVVVSSEVAPVAVLAAVVGLAGAGAPVLVEQATRVLDLWLRAAGPIAVRDDAIAPLVWRTGVLLATALGPFVLAIAAVG